MQCPKCFGEMEEVHGGPITISRCSACYGMYFSELTRTSLPSLSGLADVDVGDEARGAEFNETVYVECPKCNRIMDQRLTDDPVHVRFELCTACHSGFLDAGEYRRYLAPEFKSHFEKLLPP